MAAWTLLMLSTLISCSELCGRGDARSQHPLRAVPGAKDELVSRSSSTRSLTSPAAAWMIATPAAGSGGGRQDKARTALPSSWPTEPAKSCVQGLFGERVNRCGGRVVRGTPLPGTPPDAGLDRPPGTAE